MNLALPKGHVIEAFPPGIHGDMRNIFFSATLIFLRVNSISCRQKNL